VRAPGLQAGENDPGVLANAAEVLAGFGEDIGAMNWLTAPCAQPELRPRLVSQCYAKELCWSDRCSISLPRSA
jgi:hypothetical protein